MLRQQCAVSLQSEALSPCCLPVPPKLETRDQHQHLLPEGPGTMMSTMEMPSILHPYGLSCLWGQSRQLSLLLWSAQMPLTLP